MPDVERTPFSLYVHFPWCVHKCPYCDFNSHAIKGTIPEQAYIDALIADLDRSLSLVSDRPVSSMFFGGGTPSLISGSGMKNLLSQLKEKLELVPEIEITLEANPGTIDAEHFVQYKDAGINRLSIGAQSFRDQQLRFLGRIHSSQDAVSAYMIARNAGFENINIDLMFGLSGDTLQGSLSDMEQAIALNPEHISWYQLTIEPNTLFCRQRPLLPADDAIWEIQQAGQSMLTSAGYNQYEVSAYAKVAYKCRHNLNYWLFGDYLGIGAGAHSKISSSDSGLIQRFSKPRHPKQYLSESEITVQHRYLDKQDLILEFMMNILRLNQGFTIEDFESTTGLSFSELDQMMKIAVKKGLVRQTKNHIKTTARGQWFLNDLLEIFSG